MPDDPLDAVLIGGREAVAIVVVDYDATWPARFAEVRDRVATALGPVALDVRHIGSTSVPGLAAKPVVDVLLTVPDVADEPAYLSALEALGLALRVREPGHRMLRTPARDVHLHVLAPDDPAVTDYLDLRDWLRRSPEDRSLYAAAKRALAERSWADMNEYAEAKSPVIAQVLGRARAWRARAAGDSPLPPPEG
jgi:GrpB-like predicted nucleotidyltransferase (UPF0157 family)